MIVVDGGPFPPDAASSSSPSATEVLGALLDHPYLVSASDALRGYTELNFAEHGAFRSYARPRCTYVFQREYATVDPSLVDFAGTDEATTCVGLVIRNQQSGRTSIAHVDSPNVVELGLTQMLSGVLIGDSQAELDVLLRSSDLAILFTNSRRYMLARDFFEYGMQLGEENHGTDGPEEWDGYSLPLCAKIIECLWKRGENFHIQTLFVLRHNTRMDSEGEAFPISCGCLVEISTGSLFPVCFDGHSRGPDEIVRRIRITACNDDPTWKGKLLDTYGTESDEYRVAPCSWSRRHERVALALQHLSDSQILMYCSTSPSAEGPDFAANLRRKYDYLIRHPDWRETFPGRQPRVFKRSDDGDWIRS